MSANVAPARAQRQRLSGTGRVASRLRIEDDQQQSVLDDLYQSGSARIRFPAPTDQSVHAVLLNTAGGLTGDDRLVWQATAGQSSTLTVSTAACEKLYRTHGPAALATTQLKAESQSHLRWLPQETIAFDGSSLKRTLTADIAVDATALIAESLVFSRQAMHETLNRIDLHDQWRIYREGYLLHAEDFRLNGDWQQGAQQQGALHHFRAISTVIRVSHENIDALQWRCEALRSYCQSEPQSVIATVSAMPNRIIMRLAATNSYQLRKILIPCIELLSDNTSIPAVWHV